MPKKTTKKKTTKKKLVKKKSTKKIISDSKRLDLLHRRVFDLNEIVAKFDTQLNKVSVGMFVAITLGAIAIVIAISIMMIHTHAIQYDYDYCVEWDGWIQRENLFMKCFDFTDNGMDCVWKFKNDHSLEVTTFYDKRITTYQCSRFVDSMEVLYGKEESIENIETHMGVIQ